MNALSHIRSASLLPIPHGAAPDLPVIVPFYAPVVHPGPAAPPKPVLPGIGLPKIKMPELRLPDLYPYVAYLARFENAVPLVVMTAVALSLVYMRGLKKTREVEEEAFVFPFPAQISDTMSTI